MFDPAIEHIIKEIELRKAIYVNDRISGLLANNIRLIINLENKNFVRIYFQQRSPTNNVLTIYGKKDYEIIEAVEKGKSFIGLSTNKTGELSSIISEINESSKIAQDSIICRILEIQSTIEKLQEDTIAPINTIAQHNTKALAQIKDLAEDGFTDTINDLENTIERLNRVEGIASGVGDRIESLTNGIKYSLTETIIDGREKVIDQLSKETKQLKKSSLISLRDDINVLKMELMTQAKKRNIFIIIFVMAATVLINIPVAYYTASYFSRCSIERDFD